MNYLLNDRFDENLEPFEKGHIFCDSSGNITDLNDITVLNIAVDTIKQLYSGTIDQTIIRALDHYSSDGGVTITKYELDSYKYYQHGQFTIPFDCRISKMGKNSGYQYKLQNNEVGIIILLKSFHKPNDTETSHLKIELSPHFLSSHTPTESQTILDNISNIYLENALPAAVSPHICVDIQGWSMPNHMQDHIISRCKQIKTYNGIDKAEFQGLDNILTTFGRNETLMVGTTKSLQTSIYRKDLEIIKSDKVDYYHDIWDQYSLGSFDKTLPVTRIEQRFHHNVIKEFQRGIGEDINTYLEISEYFNDLWNYALNTIRYQIKGTISPLYQFLMEDVHFNQNDLRQSFKRQQKPKKDITSITRQIGLFLGNFITLKARSKINFKYVKRELESMSVFDEITLYILEKKQDLAGFWRELEQRYLERCILSKYA